MQELHQETYIGIKGGWCRLLGAFDILAIIIEVKSTALLDIMSLRLDFFRKLNKF